MTRLTLSRLEPLARAALDEYGVVARELQSLKYYNNATYRVVASGGAEYVLRVTSNHYSETQLLSEMQWLRAMQGDREVRVPDPLEAKNGALVVRATAAGVAEPRLCVLCRWVPGTPRSEAELGASDFARVGHAASKLHRRSAAFRAPAEFTRPRWDESRFSREAESDALAHVIDFLAVYLELAELERVRSMTDELQTRMRARREDPACRGLVHGDFHAGNYVFDGDAVGFIDFEDLGWGDFLYDAATASFGALERPEYPSLLDTFSMAYGDDRVPRRDLRLFQLFRALFLTDLAVNRGDAAERTWWEGYALGKLRRLLA